MRVVVVVVGGGGVGVGSFYIVAVLRSPTDQTHCARMSGDY